MECHELDIEISPTGEVKILVRGVKGPGCKEYARLLEQILDQEGVHEHTSEFYASPTGVEIHIEEEERRS